MTNGKIIIGQQYTKDVVAAGAKSTNARKVGSLEECRDIGTTTPAMMAMA